MTLTALQQMTEKMMSVITERKTEHERQLQDKQSQYNALDPEMQAIEEQIARYEIDVEQILDDFKFEEERLR